MCGGTAIQRLLKAQRSEIKYLEKFNKELLEEIAQWKTWGIIEIAVRNPNVAEYIKHWEERAVKAEEQLDNIYRQQSYSE